MDWLAPIYAEVTEVKNNKVTDRYSCCLFELPAVIKKPGIDQQVSFLMVNEYGHHLQLSQNDDLKEMFKFV